MQESKRAVEPRQESKLVADHEKQGKTNARVKTCGGTTARIKTGGETTKRINIRCARNTRLSFLGEQGGEQNQNWWLNHSSKTCQLHDIENHHLPQLHRSKQTLSVSSKIPATTIQNQSARISGSPVRKDKFKTANIKKHN